MRKPRRRPEPIRWLREEVPVLVDRLDRRALLIGGGVLAGLVLIWALVTGPLSSDDEPGETRVVTVAVESDDPREAPVGALGFPLVATRNTTRVGGSDSASNAAAVALATHPPAPGVEPIESAVLVPDDDWQAGVAAASLAGPPLRAPLLIGTATSTPSATDDALAQLHPRGEGSEAAIYTAGPLSVRRSQASCGFGPLSAPLRVSGSTALYSGRPLGRVPKSVSKIPLVAVAR